MEPATLPWLPALIFVLLTLLVSLPLYAYVKRKPEIESLMLTALIMIAPSVAAVLTRLIFGQGFVQVGWLPRAPGLLLIGLFLPLAIEFLTLAIARRLNAFEQHPEFLIRQDGKVGTKRFALLWGGRPRPPLLFWGNYLISFAVATLIYLPFGLGEEFGWRGYLQLQLGGLIGPLAAMVLTGLVWGFWHAPFVLYTGHNYPEYRRLGAFVLMPVMCVVFALMIGIAYLRSGSIWVPALYHAAINMGAQISTQAVQSYRKRIVFDLVWLGLWTLAAAGFVAWWLITG